MIRLKVIDLPTTMLDLPEGQSCVFEMVNNILIEEMGTIADQERLTIKQRQAEMAESTNPKGFSGKLAEALKAADVFVGVSAAHIVSKEMVCGWIG